MKNRSVAMVIILGLITLGIYPLIWFSQTRSEMLEKGIVDKMMSPWMVLIPFIGFIFFIIFLVKYSEGVEKATNGKYSRGIALILLFFLGGIGQGLIQSAYNDIPEGSTTGSTPFGA